MTVACDTETGGSAAGLEVFGDKATFHPYAGAFCTGISVCLHRPGDPYLVGNYIPVGHIRGNVSPDVARTLVEALNGTRARHTLHHGVFDYPFLAQVGPYEPRVDTIDTQVTRWFQNENQIKGLKDIGEMYLGEDAGKEKRELREARESVWENQTHAYKAVREAYPEIPVAEAREMAREMRKSRGWHQITVEEMAPYAARDSSLTEEVRELLLPDLTDVHPSLEREFALQPILYGMTKRGTAVDIAQLDAAAVVYGLRAVVLKEGLDHEFRGALGLKPGTELNPASSQQCQRLLYDLLELPVMLRTKTGAPATDKNALEMLQGHPVASRVLEYRKWRHAADSYAIGFAKHARLSPDGRIHGHYRSDGTVTGRLSASGPNVMTIPREDSLPEIQAAFKWTPPGTERYEFDLASAELWVTASITDDPVLTSALLEGRNLHVETMLRIFGGEPDKSRREYTLSKNGNYGVEYGAGIAQLTIYAAKVGCSPTEAKEVAAQFHEGHKATFARQHRVADYLAAEAEKRGKLPLHIPGRYRHFHGGQFPVHYYTALNALVQGGVAEWMKTNMLELKKRGYEELMMLQVHDSFVFEGPPGLGPELLGVLNDIKKDCNPFKFPIQWDQKR